MGKYEPLKNFLSAQPVQEVQMSFRDIENIIGTTLPESKQYPAWWSNNPSNNVMTKAWLAAGFRTERVDIGGERLVFRRDKIGVRQAVGPEPSRLEPRSEPVGFLARLRAKMGGSVRIAPGVDLTVPTGEHWDAEG